MDKFFIIVDKYKKYVKRLKLFVDFSLFYVGICNLKYEFVDEKFLKNINIDIKIILCKIKRKGKYVKSSKRKI